MGKATYSPFSYGPHFDAATGKRPQCVGIRCRCGKEDHAAAPGPGYGRRIFKERGWHVADRMGRHDCPECVATKKTVRHIDVAPVGPVVTQPAPQETPMQNTIMADKLGEAVLTRFQLAAKSTAGRRGAADGFKHNTQARYAAERAAKRAGIKSPVRNEHYALKHHDDDGTWSFTLLTEPLSLSEIESKTKGPGPQFGIPKGTYTPQGTPPVVRPYALRAGAQKAARKYYISKGVDEPMEGQHYVTSQRGTGPKRWWVTLIDPRGIPEGGVTPIVPQDAEPFTPRLTISASGLFPADRRYTVQWNAARAATTFLQKKGITDPRPGIHFSTVGNDTDGYAVVILDPRGRAEGTPVVVPDLKTKTSVPLLAKNWGYLSSFDAKKAAFAHFDRAGRTSGSPVQGVDYWLVQDARNLWGFSLTDPNPKPEPEVPEIAPEPPKEAAPMSDASTQAVRDQEETTSLVVETRVDVRQPTLTDNRRIRSAVEDKYDEAKQMYVGNWSDRMLAEDLKVPRAWVTRVREMYGPDVNNDAAIRAEAAKMQAKQRVLEAIELAAKATGISNTILELAAALETTMAELKAKQAEIG